MTDRSSTIDELLKVEDDFNLPEFSGEQEKEQPKITQHNLSTSPWSRLLIVAVPFGSAFFIIFLFLNSIFNPSTKEAKTAKQSQETSSVVEEKVEQQDGDVYAKLALSEQADELNKINEHKTRPSQIETHKTQEVVSNSTPPAPRTAQAPTRYQQPTPRVSRVNSSPAPPRSFVNPSPRVNNLVTTPTKKAIDPTAEFNRLRSIGSYGLIAYANNSVSSSVGESTIPDPGESSSFTQSTPPLTEPANIVDAPESTFNENTSSDIEQIRPRWQADTQLKSDKAPLEQGVGCGVWGVGKEIAPTYSGLQAPSLQDDCVGGGFNLSSMPSSLPPTPYPQHPVLDKYLPQEKQILQERQTRYLTVGEYANGVLVTPVVKPQTANDKQKTEDDQRFVAKLTQDLHDNYGEVAIPRDTLLAVELVSVDAGNYATARVRSIIKDNTEYPLSPGAISVQGQGGKPLIARKFQDKGGEIAQYDLTVGLVGGLAKVGEIINQPDVQQSIQTGFGGGFSNTNIQNNRRNIGGAFLQGAFEKLGDIVSSRAERSTQEILARPNVWYIPQGTKVSFIVNRTLELL